jgi:tRNA A37 N6-isopentenylltransferase MiaA
MPKELREQKIKARVQQRFELAKKEVQEQILLNKKAKNDSLAFSSTGFMELQKFIAGEIGEEDCLNLWQLAEIQYAKRQDTWWKKRNNLIEIATEKI